MDSPGVVEPSELVSVPASKMEVAMVRPDLNAWGHTLADLRRLAVQAQHPRSRERLLALYMIASQQTNATTWAAHIGRIKETVLNWVHPYNLAGLDGVIYRHTGGRRPLLTKNNATNSSTRWSTPTRSTMAYRAMSGP